MTDALIGFAAIFALALLRIPLAFAMGLVGIVGLGLLRGWPATAAKRLPAPGPDSRPAMAASVAASSARPSAVCEARTWPSMPTQALISA